MAIATERSRNFAHRFPRCRACRLPSAEGRRLIAGPGVYLCERCVALLATGESAVAPAERCSFCGRRDVPIAGALPSIALCAACIELSQSMLAEDNRPSRPAT
jgi:ATP-dependent protease Clp ATPase subunit